MGYASGQSSRQLVIQGDVQFTMTETITNLLETRLSHIAILFSKTDCLVS